MTPDRSHSDTVGHVANKVRVEGGEALLKPYFYIPKYRSSDVLPAPEIFMFSLGWDYVWRSRVKFSFRSIRLQNFLFCFSPQVSLFLGGHNICQILFFAR